MRAGKRRLAEAEARDGLVVEAAAPDIVERRSTAEIIQQSVAMVPGIVAVHADLPWSLDDRDVREPDLHEQSVRAPAA